MPGLLLTALYRIICIHASRNTFLCRAADAHTSLCSITYRVAALRDDTPIFRPQKEKVAVATATDGTAEVEVLEWLKLNWDQGEVATATDGTAEVVSSEEGEMSEVEGAPAAEPASNSDSKRSEAEVEEVSGTGNGQDDSKGTLV